MFRVKSNTEKPLPNYRGLTIPYVSFGTVTSDDLFADKEQALFDFYAASSLRYVNAVDIGANIGVHSILMAEQGWIVKAFEPDDQHFEHLCRNLERNGVDALVERHNRAVSDFDGVETFVRVKGNTTGSHLKGDKTPYGELEEFDVLVSDCRPLFAWADFCKMDCEGHEARLLKTVSHETTCEFMVEVGTPANAEAIYRHFQGWRGMWAQQSGWKPVKSLADVPSHHSQGALFIGNERPFK